MITAMSPVSVVVAQPDAPLFGHTYSLEDFEALLLQNIDDNLSLVDKPETRYEIYQVADTEQAHKYIFLSLKSLEKSGLAVERKNYQLVYSGTLGEGENLDTLFERFNINHPDDFSGHSMSVSDVVVLTKYGESKAYFCDDVGFPEVPSFLSQEQLQEYILLHPEERAVSWIYYNPDGNQGKQTPSLNPLTLRLAAFITINVPKRLKQLLHREKTSRAMICWRLAATEGLRSICTGKAWEVFPISA